jgi:hypothetical protein
MTSDQRKAISNPAMGLLVFDTDKQTIYLFDGVNWKPMMVTLDHMLPLMSRQPAGITPLSKFGNSVDIYENYAIAGAPGDTANNLSCGAAYIYYKDNGSWKQQVKLSAPNAVAGDKFGYSVSIYNDVVVIGAPGKAISGSSEKGRVYVYKRSGHVWNLVIGLQASNGLAYDHFGTAVAIDGQMIVAGAPETDYSGKTDAGTAYVFRFENNAWIQKKIFTPADPVNNGHFGLALDISATTIAVGAPAASIGATTSVGAVYIFNNTDFTGTNWVNGQKLEPDEVQQYMEFGKAIDIDGDRMMIGAPSTKHGDAVYAGRCLHFTRANGLWTNNATLNSLNAMDRAGTAVAILGDYYLTSYPGWQDQKGRVIRYRIDGNEGFKYLYDDDRDAIRFFGNAIAAHNGQFIIGANGYSAGAVFFGVID